MASGLKKLRENFTTSESGTIQTLPSNDSKNRSMTSTQDTNLICPTPVIILADVVNVFLNAKADQRDAGEITARHWQDYYETSAHIIK